MVLLLPLLFYSHLVAFFFIMSSSTTAAAASAPAATTSPSTTSPHQHKRKWGQPSPGKEPHPEPQPQPELPDVDEENEEAPGEAVIQLAEALVNIESVSGREQRMAKALATWLKKRGWKVILQPVAPAVGHEAEGKRWNVYASRPEGEGQRDGKGPRILLNTHIDTVPPFYPASVDRKEGVIRGRGACDTKR